jgi:hypothetical protein
VSATTNTTTSSPTLRVVVLVCAALVLFACATEPPARQTPTNLASDEAEAVEPVGAQTPPHATPPPVDPSFQARWRLLEAYLVAADAMEQTHESNTSHKPDAQTKERRGCGVSADGTDRLKCLVRPGDDFGIIDD